MEVHELYRKGIKICDNLTVRILHNSSVIRMARENNRQGRGSRRIHDSDAWRSHGPRQVRALFARFFCRAVIGKPRKEIIHAQRTDFPSLGNRSRRPSSAMSRSTRLDLPVGGRLIRDNCYLLEIANTFCRNRKS